VARERRENGAIRTIGVLTIALTMESLTALAKPASERVKTPTLQLRAAMLARAVTVRASGVWINSDSLPG
jgi:hypothetical protein